VGPFKRSAWFAIIGIFVVAAAVVAIGLSADPQDADPKLQYGLIFGVLGVFIVAWLFLQGRDISAAEDTAKRGTARATASGPSEVENPTTMDEADLWAAMAVKPISGDAAKARAEMWGPARRSRRLGIVIFALIFLTVPPIYLLDTFVTLYIGVPLIVLAAIYGAARALRSGGELDQGFDRLGATMEPLGLKLTARPEVRFEPRMPPLWGANARLRGAMALEGKRHDRVVSVNQEDTTSVTTVKGATPSFEAQARDGRIRPDEDAPESVAAALQEVPNSTRWKGVSVRGGRGGIVVERKGNRGEWLCDLWLAERLASRF
jgi:hypothetical protein